MLVKKNKLGCKRSAFGRAMSKQAMSAGFLAAFIAAPLSDNSPAWAREIEFAPVQSLPLRTTRISN